jgi:hypothetical protein
MDKGMTLTVYWSKESGLSTTLHNGIVTVEVHTAGDDGLWLFGYREDGREAFRGRVAEINAWEHGAVLHGYSHPPGEPFPGEMITAGDPRYPKAKKRP